MITRKYKLDLIAKIMETKSMKPRLGEDQIAKELGCASCSKQRYRQKIKMLSPYLIPPKSEKKTKVFKL